MNPRIVEIPDMSLWSQSIGGLIINFGIVEFQTLRWLQRLGGEQLAIDARRDTLSRRIKSVIALLSSSALSEGNQSKARELWTEVSDLSRTRNRIAHNPICVGRDCQTGELALSIIDLQLMEPTSENPLETLHYSYIAYTALRAREIGRELSEMIESIP